MGTWDASYDWNWFFRVVLRGLRCDDCFVVGVDLFWLSMVRVCTALGLSTVLGHARRSHRGGEVLW